MKILYDHQIFASQKYGGISRYFYELSKEISKINNIDAEITLSISNNHYISDNNMQHLNFLSEYNFKGKVRLFNYINKYNTLKILKKQNFEVFHPTYYDPYFLSYIEEKPFVLTVYDMIHEKFSELFDARDKTSQRKKLLVEKATKIIAISESTKKDLIELWGVKDSKIAVVYLGNSMVPTSNKCENTNIPSKYLLFVGSRSGYKNFDRFIQSISGILLRDKNLFVVCAGGGKFNSDELYLFSSLNIFDQIQQHNFDDESLANLYQNAQLFIFPSLYEGFGIPILESFSCQCPLVCSNTSSLPEIAGEAAYYFDPYSEESMKDAITYVLENKSIQELLKQKGLLQIDKFSWEKTAIETQKIYEDILK